MRRDSFGWYVCDSCQPGFFWQEGTANEQGNCILCEEKIEGCYRCDNEEYCQQCLEGYYPSLDKTECIPPIEHCITDPSNYRNIEGAPWCILCQAGFYPVEDRCEPCESIDDNCVACKENGICTSCNASLLVAANGTTCMAKLEHCLSDPINYAVDMQGNYFCPKCDNGYTWFDSECEECEEAIPGCKVCDFHGTCWRCDEGLFLSLDRTECLEPYVNCGPDSDLTPEDYVQRMSSDFSMTEWACPSCGFGFYWDDNMWDCTARCTDWDINAEDCNEYEILKCTSDYIITPDNLAC